jgi:ACS family pantothenate transporter-like MFS transporter
MPGILQRKRKKHAVARLGQPKKYTWDRTVFKRVLLSWQFWLLPSIFMRKFEPLLNHEPTNFIAVYSFAIQMKLNNAMQLWMAPRGYTVIQENNYPTAILRSRHSWDDLLFSYLR